MVSKSFFVGILLLSLLVVGSCRRGEDLSNSNAQAQAAQDQPVPEFTDANLALAEGKRLLENGETEKAIQALEQAVKLNPDLAEGYFQLGIAWSLIEVRDKIAAETNEPTEPTPEPTKVTTGTGKKKEQKILRTNSEKYFQKAVDAYKKLTEANDQDASAFYNLGRAYNKLNEDEDAEKALRQAVKLNPDDTEFQTELGAILIKLAQYDDAVTALKKAVDLDPENSKAVDLLEDAEAGRKRVAYATKPKDEKKPANSAANSNVSRPADADGTPDPPPAERPRTINPRPTAAPTRQ
jgi:tetratricopeptide (TPR) repeat protein